MKKTLSLILAVIMLLGVFTVGVFAVNEEDNFFNQYSDEEIAAGFSFKYIYVVIKNEYSFMEFTPEMLGADIVGKIEAPYPFNPDNSNYDSNSWELFLKVYLKEQTKENIIALYREMKESEYVSAAGIAFINQSYPIYPDSPEEIGYYSGQYSPFVYPENEEYLAAEKNMLRNPYYKINYNELLTNSVSIFKKFSEYMGDVDYISYFAENYMDKDENCVTLIFDDSVWLPEYVGAIRDYNLSVLEKYFDEEDILYVGDTELAAVAKISKENRDIIKEIEELDFIGDAFFTEPPGVFPCITGICYLGNVYGVSNETKNITAGDARYILRYAAGLEKIESDNKGFYYCADMNFDGEITSADARLALRTAAGLEKTYKIEFGYSYMWDDFRVNKQ